ncbi:MAG TPA: FtsW/RodA/SpoVE family cell cycle protein [Candidatus Aminicenantes bacterium]|nr:FtsW/RodA/SpoVE family cell cycle protein [Candidatus Aminicenantes bacterium]
MRDKLHYFDKPTFLLMLLLSLTGVLLVYSAGHAGGHNYYWKQMIWLAVSLGAFLLMLRPKVETMFRFGFVLYVALLVLMALQLVIGRTMAGTRSWVGVWGMGGQISEFIKIPLALYLARTLAAIEAIDGRAFWRLTLIVGAPVVLIVLQPDFGVSFILCSFLLTAVILKRVRLAVVAVALVLVVAGGFASWKYVLKDYQKSRLVSFMDPERYRESSGYHVIQSRIAIGSGGLFGKGYLKGSQSQYQFLPTRHTDFILSVVGEEFGFVGVSVLFGMYFLLFYRQFRFKFETDEEYYFVFLFNGLVLFQFLVNVSVTVGLFPVLGVPLPFVSYGGSSLLSFFLGEAIIFKIKLSNYLA